MKATLDPAALTKALARLKPAVMRNGQLPILSGARLTYDARGLALQATDLDVRIDTLAPAEMPGWEGAIVVPHERLAALVARCHNTVTLETDGDVLHVTSGRLKATLRLMDPGEWPRTPDVDGEPHKLGDNWAAIRSVAYARSHDISRPMLGLVEVANGSATTTDSYRLATVAGVDESLDVLLPGNLVNAVDGADLELVVGERWLELRSDDTAWAAVRPEGDFPTWRGLLPVDPPLHFTVDRAALLESLDDVATIGMDEKATKIGGVLAKFEPQADGVVVSAQHSEFGEVVATLDASDVEAPAAFAVWFSAGLLADAVSRATGDSVTLRGVDALRPWLIVDGNSTALIMPVRR